MVNFWIIYLFCRIAGTSCLHALSSVRVPRHVVMSAFLYASIVFAMAFPGISPHDSAQKKTGQMEGTTTAAGKKFLSGKEEGRRLRLPTTRMNEPIL